MTTHVRLYIFVLHFFSILPYQDRRSLADFAIPIANPFDIYITYCHPRGRLYF